MGLVLTMIAGEDFYVGHEQVLLERIISPRESVLRRMCDRAPVTVRDGRAVELFPGVFVSGGARGQLNQARLVVEAPRHIKLLRGVNYRRGRPR